MNTDGNTGANTLRVDGELIGRTAEHRYTGRAIVQTALRITTWTSRRNWTGSFRYDRFRHEHDVVNANTILANDIDSAISTCEWQSAAVSGSR